MPVIQKQRRVTRHVTTTTATTATPTTEAEIERKQKMSQAEAEAVVLALMGKVQAELETNAPQVEVKNEATSEAPKPYKSLQLTAAKLAFGSLVGIAKAAVVGVGGLGATVLDTSGVFMSGCVKTVSDTVTTCGEGLGDAAKDTCRAFGEGKSVGEGMVDKWATPKPIDLPAPIAIAVAA